MTNTLSTYTITFGDQAENHVGMAKIGTLAPTGFNLDDLNRARSWFTSRTIITEIYDLSALVETEATVEKAYLLVAKNGLSGLCNRDDFFTEQAKLEKDTKAFMYGRVVNKKARHNLCFDIQGQTPNYEQGQGRVVPFGEVPLLNTVRLTLPLIIGEKATNLKAEGNYYYDITKCGISYHGDFERRRVIGIRVGATLPLRYQWFYQSKPFGPTMDFQLEHGDIYIMSEKAVGTDWKKKNTPTLRHAAGCPKYLSV